MESVRYLIRMRDEKKAIREAKEKEEREKAGLPSQVTSFNILSIKSHNVMVWWLWIFITTQEEEKPDDKIEESNKDLLEIEAPSVKEDPAEVKVKEGVAVDMLSGSEEDDSTSEESSDESDDKEDGNNYINYLIYFLRWSTCYLINWIFISNRNGKYRVVSRG